MVPTDGPTGKPTEEGEVHMKVSLRPTALVVMAGLAATALAACGNEKVQDADVAKAVRAEVLVPRGITGARVKCPAETEAKKDAAIKCTVTDKDKNRGSVTATVLDEDGRLGRYQSDVDKLQMAVIETKAAEEGEADGIDGKVSCPDSTKPKEGATFFCTADIEDSGFGVVIVTQEDEASNVDVKVQRRRLRTAQIERNITRAVRKQVSGASVSCPDRVTSQKGKTFECTVRNPANGKSLTVVATQTDDAGNFRLKVK
jgi:hypothetical protein